MAYIVDENCIDCLHKNCVEVCPVNCFHLGKNMVVIDPSECIDCGNCVPTCPTEAIRSLDEPSPKSDRNQYWADFNEYYAKKWPRISDIQEELPKDLSIYSVFTVKKEKCQSAKTFAPLEQED